MFNRRACPLINVQTQRGNATNHVDSNERSLSMSSNVRKSSAPAKLPSPPPAIPLPPLPTTAPNHASNYASNANSGSPPDPNHLGRDLVNAQLVEDQEARIRTIEKHLFAEKQLTATLEEALVDLETQGHKIRADMEAWKKKAKSYDDELQGLRKERNSHHRSSLQAVEEEKHKRKEAEAARAHLEERMAALSKKKKKSALNCF